MNKYEQLEEKFKLYAGALEGLDYDEDGHDERQIRESIDFVLDEVVSRDLIKPEPIEDKVYAVTFAGRYNGKLRKMW